MSMILDGSNGVTFNDASLQGAAASPYVLKNRIINGAMTVSQRGSTSHDVGAFAWGVDRFGAYENTSASSVTAAQSSTAPAGFINSLLYKLA